VSVVKADEIAAELKRRGQLVRVVEIDSHTDWASAAIKGLQLQPSTSDSDAAEEPGKTT
jgi:hypothetical protein